MAMLEVERVLARARRAQARKQAFRALLQDCYRFAMPERDAFSGYAEGQRRDLHIFDSTAVVATTRFANRLQAVLCPPFQKWATLRPGSEIPPAMKRQVAELLERDSERLFAHIHASNFDAAVNEMFHDLAASTGFMLVEGRVPGRSDGTLLRHTTVPSGLVAWEEGPFGKVEGVYYALRMPARNVARSFPDGEIPEALARRAAEHPEEEVEILLATTFDADDDVFRCDAIWEAGPARLVSRRYRTNPWIVVPWLRAAGELEGRGPLVQALGDIKTLNKVKELVLKNASLAVAGAYTVVDDGVINPATVRIAPGSMIPVASNGGARGPSIQPLPRSGDFAVSELVINDLQTAIKKAMFDNQLPPDAGPVRSATEIVQRMKELQQDIGAPFGRLNANFVVPYIARVLDILDEAGEVVLPLKVNGREVAIVPVSPLAKAQNLDNVQAIADAASLLGGFGPQALARGLKVDAVPRYVAEQIGVPASLVPSEQDIAAQAQQEQQQALMQTLAQSPVAARVAGNLTAPNAAPQAAAAEPAA